MSGLGEPIRHWLGAGTRALLSKWHAQDRALQLSSVLAVAAAVVVTVLVNIVGARHYRRWDWTAGGLYTLSPATVQTLKALREPVQVHVLLSATDPLTLTLRHTLAAYRAVTTKLEPEFIDPDTHAAALAAIQQRYGIAAGRTEDGQIVTDASVIVAQGERHYFITSTDLVHLDDPAEPTAQPRIEQAITKAVRQVVAGEPAKVCFTRGHAEASIADAGAQGVGALSDRLAKSNYLIEELDPLRELRGRDPILGCKVVIVAGPKQPFSAEDATRLRAHIEAGGSALLALGPVHDPEQGRSVELGLGPVLRLAGVARHDDVVFEPDPTARVAQGFGEAFLAHPKPHAITAGLLTEGESQTGVFVQLGSSLGEPSQSGESVATALLVTSSRAFGMSDFLGWARAPRNPEPAEGDRRGPLTMAFATELGKRDPGADHGPRIVVLGASNLLDGVNWQLDDLRPTALFVESAVSWLSSEKVMLDIPDKPPRTVGLRLTEDALGSILRYCLLYVPLGTVLLGMAVRLRRRSTEARVRPPRKARSAKSRKGRGTS